MDLVGDASVIIIEQLSRCLQWFTLYFVHSIDLVWCVLFLDKFALLSLLIAKPVIPILFLVCTNAALQDAKIFKISGSEIYQPARTSWWCSKVCEVNLLQMAPLQRQNHAVSQICEISSQIITVMFTIFAIAIWDQFHLSISIVSRDSLPDLVIYSSADPH